MSGIQIFHGQSGFYNFQKQYIRKLKNDFEKYKTFKTLIICPSNRWERRLQSELLEEMGSIFSAEIYSYDSFIRSIHSKIKLMKPWLIKKKPIKEQFENLIIEDIILQNADEFKYFSINETNLKSFSIKLRKLFYTFYSLSYSADSFISKFKDSPNNKYKDLGLIYKLYENKIKDGFYNNILAEIDILNNLDDKDFAKIYPNVQEVIAIGFDLFKSNFLKLIYRFEQFGLRCRIALWGNINSDSLIHSKESLNLLASNYTLTEYTTLDKFRDKKLFYQQFYRLEDELDNIFDQVQEKLLKAKVFEEIIICVANLDKYAAVIRKKSFERKIPVNITALISLIEAPLMHDILSLLNVLKDDFRFEDIQKLINSEFLRFPEDLKIGKEIVELKRRNSKNFFKRSDFSEEFVFFRNIDEDIRYFKSKQKISDIFSRLYTILNSLELFKRIRTETETEIIIELELNNRAFYRFYEILEELQTSLSAIYSDEMFAADLFNILEKEVFAENFQLGNRETVAIKIMPLLEARSETADIFFIAGLNESNIPKKNTDESILKLLESDELGISSINYPLEEDRYLLNFLMNKDCAEIYLSSHKKFLETEEIESVFIDEFRSSYKILSWPNVPELKDKVKKKISLESGHFLIEQKDKVYSISEFEEYFSCSYKYFMNRFIKIKHLPDIDTDETALKFGNLIHTVFYEVYRNNINYPDLSRDIKIELFEGELERIIKLDTNFTIQEKELIKRFIDREKYLEKLFDEEEKTAVYKPAFFEWSFGLDTKGDDVDKRSTEKPLHIEEYDIYFSGKIDRIDEDASGNVLVLDYKNSKSQSFEDYYQLKKFQLALYVLAVNELLQKKVNAAVLFQVHPESIKKRMGLHDSDEFKGRENRRIPETFDTDLSTYLVKVKEELARIRDDIQAGKFSLNPIDENICKYCDFKFTCRILEKEELSYS